MLAACARKQVGQRQSSAKLAESIGRRKSSAAHQHEPVVAPHSNAAPQRAQVRARGVVISTMRGL